MVRKKSMLKVYDSSWESPKGLDGYTDGSSKKTPSLKQKATSLPLKLGLYKRPQLGRKFQLNQLTIIFQGRSCLFQEVPSPSLRWNLKMMVSNRNLLFQGLIFRFHVKLRGCMLFFLFPGICKEQRLCGWWSISRLDFLKFNDFVCHPFLSFLYHAYPKNHHSNKPSICFWLGMIFCGFSFV